MSNSKAIVTGAPGWLGSRLVRALVEGLGVDAGPLSGTATADRPIRVGKLPGSDDKELRTLSKKIELLDCDITDTHSVKSLFDDAEGATVFHCAGIIHPSSGCKQFYQVNVDGTR
ncbi:MAG: NAD-dependent epimerase/dehydratase family protein, partial [Candidatus Obscuribacterales bacterium]|nr:NAD-dependent epimerase/dehydratase family protein [Candidatus Obscuribacterales bacterium]